MPHTNNDIIPTSELILNKDGSVYHLRLKTNDIAQTIITVGDPDRVEEVTKHFNTVEMENQHREFKTATGSFRGKRLTVISTGIGTDNVDIVLNELDALVNIDLKTRRMKDERTTLNFIRIGTSGAMQPDIPLDSFVASELALGFDNLLRYYPSREIQELPNWPYGDKLPAPHLTQATTKFVQTMPDAFLKGVTATMPGFYAPQGRQFRLNSVFNSGLSELQKLRVDGKRLTNIEMETSGIYGLAHLLEHRAISLNAILANRITGEFSQYAAKTIDDLIEISLDWIVKEMD